MAIRFKEVGTGAVVSAAYGGLVMAMDMWDAKRIAANSLANKDFYKKAGFYAYAGVGVISTALSLMDSPKVMKYHKYTDILANNFFYDAPRFVKNLVHNHTAATPAGLDAGANAAAIAEANAIVASRRRAAAGRNAGDQFLPKAMQPGGNEPLVPTVQPQSSFGMRGNI